MSDPPGESRRQVAAVRRPFRRPVRSRSPAQERHHGQSTQVTDGPSSRRDLPHPGGHRRDVARGRGAQAAGPGGPPQLRTGAACGFFERRRVPRVIAVLLTVALALGCLSGIGYVVVRQLSMLAYQLPSYKERIQEKVNFLKPSNDTVFS